MDRRNHERSWLLAGRQGRLVLAYLVCERSRAVSREELADLLWPDELPQSWSSSLSVVLSRLRRLLTEAGLDGSTALLGSTGSYRLVLPPDTSVDWDVAHAALARAESAIADGDTDAARAAATRRRLVLATSAESLRRTSDGISD